MKNDYIVQNDTRAMNKRKKESEIGIRTKEEMGFKTTARGGERWNSGDMR